MYLYDYICMCMRIYVCVHVYMRIYMYMLGINLDESSMLLLSHQVTT